MRCIKSEDLHKAGFFGTARVGNTRYVHKVEALGTATLQQETDQRTMRDEKEKAIDFLNQQALADARQKETTT